MTFINLGLNHTLSECLIILYFVNSPTPLTQFFFLVNKTPTAVNMLHMRKYYKENDVSYAFMKTTGIYDIPIMDDIVQYLYSHTPYNNSLSLCSENICT